MFESHLLTFVTIFNKFLQFIFFNVVFIDVAENEVEKKLSWNVICNSKASIPEQDQ